MLLLFLLPISALTAPDEASGTVTNVVDGDTFDIRIEKTDPRIIYDIERVRLADVDSPEMSTPEGPLAKTYTNGLLLGKKVWLDIDNKSSDGRDPYNRLLAVVYLEETNVTAWISTNTTIMEREAALDYYDRLASGRETEMENEDLGRGINTTHPFNRMLVDAGFAEVKDFTNNEFDPSSWWTSDASLEAESRSIELVGENLFFPAADDHDNWLSAKSNTSDSTPWTTQATPNDEWLSCASGEESGGFTTAATGQFVGSLESDKYHYPSCRWAKKILPENEIWFSSSEEARAAGYFPCGVCHPP